MIFEIKTTVKVGQFVFSFTIPFIKKTLRFMIYVYRNPDTWTSGQTSRCKDGRHILFFDYDNMGLKEVEDEITYLQEYYRLSDAYVFENDKDKSFHVIILDKFTLFNAHSILKSSNIEWSYLESPKIVRSHEWVLRISEKGKRKKPEFLEVIKSEFDLKQISTAHKLFLMKYYEVPVRKYNNEDNIQEIGLVNYNTGNRLE